MVYKAIDIAKYVVNYCNNKKYTITNKRLNYLLYFVQALFIQEKNEICFDDDVHCYPSGPVIPSIHRRYRMYGNTNIPKEQQLFWNDEIRGFDYKEIIFTINDEDKTIIDSLIEETKNMTNRYLEEIVFNQTPFCKNFVPNRDTIIPVEDFYSYFR